MPSYTAGFLDPGGVRWSWTCLRSPIEVPRSAQPTEPTLRALASDPPARFAGPRGPLRRQESQNTCPQLVRLKDDFLCGGWKQRLQNTQLAMTRDPRRSSEAAEVGTDFSVTPRSLERRLCACAYSSACVLERGFPPKPTPSQPWKLIHASWGNWCQWH